MNSLFEVYDPYTFFMDLSLNWFPVVGLFFAGVSEFWVLGSASLLCFSGLANSLVKEFSNFYDFKKIKSSMILFVSLFFFLLIINILGLIPYVFSCSSHFVFSMSLGLPMWISFFLLSFFLFTKSSFAHLVPTGTPLVLISFMAVIEGISSLIRPWSLGIRLMANMISGHLLMSLLGDCGLGFLIIQFGLFIFEFFVCFIQAFVFSALLTLYSSEI
uniref:ATP synthase subunit a n=1 Tax=Singhiella simplex TaxID=1608328 RepID=A0A7G2CXQ5_9HEMI|nr:ATP synthase F0 subunit 6 [Singhiella simplex]